MIRNDTFVQFLELTTTQIKLDLNSGGLPEDGNHSCWRIKQLKTWIESKT